MSSGSESGSDAGSLEEALDAYVDWAREEHVLEEVPGLPPRVAQRVGPGRRLGDFELDREMGSGGMGIVYEARQRSLGGRRVAVKVLRNPFASGRLEERFRREVQTIGALDHPCIVPVVAAGVEGGVPYYAMRYIEGISAAAVVRELRRRGGPPEDVAEVRRLVERGSSRDEGGPARPDSSDDSSSVWESTYPRWVARLGLGVAEALQHAHEHEVVHRDVKPANVVIQRSGRPMLLDFGLASRPLQETLTEQGGFLGTLAYAAPEQVRGEDVDTRADVYSLGATLYELLSLRRPFDAPSRTALLRRIEVEDPPPLRRGIPDDLRTILGCALAKSSARRYASPGEMAHDLREFLAGRPIAARPPGRVERAGRWIQRHPVRAVALVLVPLLLAAGAVRMRQHLRADARVAEGVVRLENTAGHFEALDVLLAELDELRDWRSRAVQPRDERIETARESIRGLRREIDVELREAEALFLRALENVGDHAAARTELARLFAVRLGRAFADHADLYEPERVRLLEDRLRWYDDRDAWARMLDPRGSLRLASEPPGARVTLLRDRLDGELHPTELSGVTPLAVEALEEGSYVALLAAEGRAEVRLPLLVRRRAALAREGARPPAELAVRLPLAEEVGEGYVHVAEGWTLVEDDPPRWKYLDAFQMARHEVTMGEWAAWLNGLEHEDAAAGLRQDPPVPRAPTDPDYGYLVRAEDTAGWVPRAGVGADWPVSGLTLTDAFSFVQVLNAMEPLAVGWIHDLPSLEQWTRAARGADARPYPWGREFRPDWCGGHRAARAQHADVEPRTVGSFPHDRSPFGVLDLAGSMAEATRDLARSVRGVFACRGGSFWDTEPEAMTTTSVRERHNVRRADVGVRVVKLAVPAWLLEPDAEPRAFREEFSDPLETLADRGWRVLVGRPLVFQSDPHAPVPGRVEGGRLVCEAGEGHFSEHACAWRRLHLGERDFVLRVVQSGRCRGNGASRSFGLFLIEDPVALEVALSLVLSFDGRTRLSGMEHAWGPVLEFQPDRSYVFELTVRGSRVEGRIWPEGTPRPAEALTVELPSPRPKMPFLELLAPNLVGATIAVDDVELAWID